ncbi:MAG: NADH-quinone oxidoreductase subunit J [SAR202 cluster bacterium]|nr:NADH-quinone oxidoreductase subunit J [SAR202 cluster bacterium]|tara:strand:+ start:10440 stop:10931 length:492 start_codon:yes stop_codon:yes gene_type:complete
MSVVFFAIAAILVISGGIGVVAARNIVYAALSLLVAMVGTAGVFLIGLAEFLALVQLLIYGGAVVIVILFSLMLTRIQDFEFLKANRQWPIALIVAMSLLGLLGIPILIEDSTTTTMGSTNISELGLSLFSDWAIPFELASLVLLIALIGAVVVVRRDNGEDK